MIKIHVNPASTPALSVMFAANACGIEHEVMMVDLGAQAHRTPEYLKINPVGKVPALSDGDFHLFESGAILRYLARKSKSELYPVEYQARARVDQWVDYVAHHVRSPFSRVHFNRMFAKMFGEQPDEASIALGLKFLSVSLPIVDAQISKQGYVASEQMSLADIALLATLDPCEILGIDLRAYTALLQWRDTLRGKAFYTDVHAHYGQDMGLG